MVGFPFNPQKVKLLEEDLRAAQFSPRNPQVWICLCQPSFDSRRVSGGKGGVTRALVGRPAHGSWGQSVTPPHRTLQQTLFRRRYRGPFRQLSMLWGLKFMLQGAHWPVPLVKDPCGKSAGAL